MLKLKFISILIIWANSIFAYASGVQGFNEICQIYTEAQNSSMKKVQLSNYIFENIKNRVNNKDALDAHDVVFLADPKERYSLFKQSAVVSLKKNWDCPAMKKLMY